MVLNVALKEPPGAIVPELNVVPLLAVDVWAIESVLTQLIESPTLMLTGFGAYAVVVSPDAPTGMLTVVVAPVVVVLPVVVPPVVVVVVVLGAGVVELLLPHAEAARRSATTKT